MRQKVEMTVLAILIILLCFLVHSYLEEMMNNANHCEICDARFNTTYINGFASSDNYYCVYTKDRTTSDIEGTDVHEKCHILINRESRHFCGFYRNETNGG